MALRFGFGFYHCNPAAQVADNVISKDHKSVTVEVSDERVEWNVRERRQFIESKFLYTLAGQNTSHGGVDYAVYAGFNRVVGGDYRVGSGLCRAVITLYADNGLYRNAFVFIVLPQLQIQSLQS